MKKVMLIGCFITGFLLLITPCDNSIEYDQVSTTITEEDFISLNKLIQSEKVSNILNEILTLVDGLCVPCAVDTWVPGCFLLYILYVHYILLFGLCTIFIWIPGFAEMANTAADRAIDKYSSARESGCAWAGRE